MKPTKFDIVHQFGRMSHAYASSQSHAKGGDLNIVLAFLNPRPTMSVLDVATGAGHAAVKVAPYVKKVTAIDLTSEMIERARELAKSCGLNNVKMAVMDVERMKFPNSSFDGVTCRIAPHHFPDIYKALHEIARVLKPSAPHVLEDSCAPEDAELDRFINSIERLRDSTHVRSYTMSEWKAMLRSVGLWVNRFQIYRKTRAVEPWLERSGMDSEGRERVYKTFAEASEKARRYFEIKYKQNLAISFTDDKLIIRAEKKS